MREVLLGDEGHILEGGLSSLLGNFYFAGAIMRKQGVADCTMGGNHACRTIESICLKPRVSQSWPSINISCLVGGQELG